MKEYRSKGLFGCFSYDDGSTESIMMLTLPKPYILDTSLTINLGVAINGNSISTSTDGTINKLEDSTLDLPLRPIIKANGNHQLLVIDDSINNTLSTPPIYNIIRRVFHLLNSMQTFNKTVACIFIICNMCIS